MEKNKSSAVGAAQPLKTLNMLNLRYKKNKILEELVQSERQKEHGIILQCFRWMVNNNIV